MRVRSLLCISAGLIVVAVSAASAQTQIPSMDELYAAAKKEGQVVFGGAIKARARAPSSSAAFNKRYPGIAVKYTRRSTEPMVQLVEAERRANRVSFDVLNLTEPGDVVRWMKQGFLAAVPIPDTDKMLPDTFDPNGYYAATSVTPMLGIYNTKVLKPGEAPKSLKALVSDPKWKGKVAISRPTRGGTSSGALMNVVEAVGRDFLKTARERDILLTLGNEAAINRRGLRRATGQLGRQRLSRHRGQGRRLPDRDHRLGRGRRARAVHRRGAGQGAASQRGAAVLSLADDAGRAGAAGDQRQSLFGAQGRRGDAAQAAAAVGAARSTISATRRSSAKATRWRSSSTRRWGCSRSEAAGARGDDGNTLPLRARIAQRPRTTCARNGCAASSSARPSSSSAGWCSIRSASSSRWGCAPRTARSRSRTIIACSPSRASSRRWSIRSSSASRPPASRSLLALPMAWAVARTNMPGRQFVRVSVLVAFVIPNFISVIAWILLLGPNAGLINVFVRETFGIARLFNIYSMEGLVLVLTFSFYPLIFFAVTAALDNMDPSYEEAAQMVGAPAWRASHGHRAAAGRCRRSSRRRCSCSSRPWARSARRRRSGTARASIR